VGRFAQRVGLQAGGLLMTADMGKFLACVGLLCLLFPPLLGLVLGVAFFLGLWWLFFKLIGG